MRIGWRWCASIMTRWNASKSASLPKRCLLPTARFSTWYTCPPGAFRAALGMGKRIPTERWPPSILVGLEESNARNSEPMFLNPLPHLLTRPCPFEWMGVQPIVLRPGLPHVIDELGSTVPRSSLQVVVTECADQQLRFVEPRGVDRGEATSPPAGGL